MNGFDPVISRSTVCPPLTSVFILSPAAFFSLSHILHFKNSLAAIRKMALNYLVYYITIVSRMTFSIFPFLPMQMVSF